MWRERMETNVVTGSTFTIGIIGDSSCDLTPNMKADMGVILAPFRVNLGDKVYVDDGNVDIPALLVHMREEKESAKSACPAVGEYVTYLRQFDACFVITLSSKLSGSYNAACAAAQIVQEETPDKEIFILDSKSATSGEVALALFLYDQIKLGKTPTQIYIEALAYIERSNTLFMLIDLDNLFKNGRITKFSKIASSALHLRPIMCADDGEIKLLKTVRGTKQALSKMVEMVKDMSKDATSNSIRLVVSHCNAYQQAIAVKEKLLASCHALQEVVLVSTGALSSMYANDGGIVLSFAL
jgi:DegV family protein with EDD domain